METSQLHPWVVIRGLLLELKSHDVPRIVDRAGLRLNWTLTKAENYSEKFKIDAYRIRIDDAYESLSEDDQLRVSYIITTELIRLDYGEKLAAALLDIGWRIEDGKLTPDNESIYELFFSQQTQHDAYVKFREILQSAKTAITIVDPYLDQNLFTLLTTAIQPNMAFQLLTAKCPSDFQLEARHWLTQNSGVTLEVRSTKDFHDRFIIIDNTQCWHIGCSIKDAGRKVFMVSAMEDSANRTALLAQITKTWQASNKIL